MADSHLSHPEVSSTNNCRAFIEIHRINMPTAVLLQTLNPLRIPRRRIPLLNNPNTEAPYVRSLRLHSLSLSDPP